MRHTTKSLASILGVHEKTLKMWEDQGVIPEPERDSRGHRLYSEEEVEKLKEIAARRREAYVKQQTRE